VEYYKKIGYLTQEPSIFDGTIRENLVYALDIEPEESVLHTVIRNAKCEFIYEFTAGLDTEIGEK
jgi:ABC-type multidrug transport system fused ATPase/permease subunit